MSLQLFTKISPWFFQISTKRNTWTVDIIACCQLQVKAQLLLQKKKLKQLKQSPEIKQILEYGSEWEQEGLLLLNSRQLVAQTRPKPSKSLIMSACYPEMFCFSSSARLLIIKWRETHPLEVPSVTFLSAHHNPHGPEHRTEHVPAHGSVFVSSTQTSHPLTPTGLCR